MRTKGTTIVRSSLFLVWFMVSLLMVASSAWAQKGSATGDGQTDPQAMLGEFKRLMYEKEQRGEDTSVARDLYNQADEALRRGDKKEYARRLRTALDAARQKAGAGWLGVALPP